jgi:hypothetical protein
LTIFLALRAGEDAMSCVKDNAQHERHAELNLEHYWQEYDASGKPKN